MTIRQFRRRLQNQRKHALRSFERHRRKNLLATPGEYAYIIVLDQLKPTFNIGKIFRSAEAFGAHEVHVIGTPFFDPTPAMGSFKWVPARFHDTFDACYQTLRERGYSLFTLDPSTGTPLPETTLPKNSAFIFGHEEFGISFDPLDYEGIASLRIPQLGKVQSLNVSIAASLVMYEYTRQHGPPRTQPAPIPATADLITDNPDRSELF
ncbi:MAG: TrmH family RNA methyltransferase [Desulfobacterales bacterium]|jgi:tRNA G18 (ribose-2'-O)-methylase SpoU|nr:TrmH family RNA methyltransferase [Desulfobacterales bacterium]